MEDRVREERRRERFTILLAALIAAASVFIMHQVAANSGTALATFPFITTLVLVCGAPGSPPAGTRAILGGHMICGAVALCGQQWFTPSDLTTAGTVGIAVAIMLALRCFHPPAGITPLIVAQFHPGWDFLLWPIFTGSLATVVLARLLERASARGPSVCPVPLSTKRGSVENDRTSVCAIGQDPPSGK